MRPRHAFTLVETLIVVTMIGLVTAIALPQMQSVRQRAQLDAASQQLVGDLRRAKIEALKRNRKVALRRTGESTYNMEYLGSRELEDGVTFSGPDSVAFASFGPTLTGPATFNLALGAYTRQVVVTASGLPSTR